MKQFGGRLSSEFRTVGFRVDPSTGIGGQRSNDLMTTANGPVRDAFYSSRRSTRIAPINLDLQSLTSKPHLQHPLRSSSRPSPQATSRQP